MTSFTIAVLLLVISLLGIAGILLWRVHERRRGARHALRRWIHRTDRWIIAAMSHSVRWVAAYLERIGRMLFRYLPIVLMRIVDDLRSGYRARSDRAGHKITERRRDRRSLASPYIREIVSHARRIQQEGRDRSHGSESGR